MTHIDPRDAAVEWMDTETLIRHILDRFHTAHRHDVPILIVQAQSIADEHADHPQFPKGLVEALQEAAAELESHMRKEEVILFPLMLDGGHPMIGHPIAQMRFEHEEHGDRITALEAITGSMTPPVDASETWTSLYAGLAKLVADLREHIRVENDILFPRFASATASTPATR